MNVRCGREDPHDEHAWIWRRGRFFNELVWCDGEIPEEQHDDLNAPESEAERYDRETRETTERT